MKTLYRRQMILTVSLILISFLALGVTFIMFSYSFTVRDKRETMALNANDIARLSVVYLSTDDPSANWFLRMAITNSSKMTGLHILVCDTSGRVVSSSDDDLQAGYIGSRIPTDTVNTLLTYGQYSALDTLGGLYSSPHYVVGVTASVMPSQQILGMVFVSMDTSELVKMWQTFSMIYFIVAISVLFATAVITSVITRRQTKPLNEMAAAAHQFAHGEFGVRVSDYGRRDEIGELSAAFNKMAESLEKSEELRRDFIASISHELKTPMTTISGYIDGILDGTISREKQADSLKIVSAEIKRLSRLVHRMLDITQLHYPQPDDKKVKFDATELLRRTLFSLEQKINSKGLDVSLEIPDYPIYSKGNPDDITRVIYNLIDNAIKFSYSGGIIKLKLIQKGQKIYISVQNTGNTIPPEELPLIFDRFHKTDRSRNEDREGIGLGLYIVKTILNNHNEDISVVSENGVTEFTFSLSASR